MHLGIVSTLTDGNIALLHGATMIFTRDAEAPERWMRAPVRCIVQAGRERLEGATVAWAATADALVAQLAGKDAAPDPVVLLIVAQQPPQAHALHERIAALQAQGKVAHLLVVPSVGALYELRVAGREVRGLPQAGQLRTRAAAARPEAPGAPRRPVQAQVVRSTLPDVAAEPAAEPVKVPAKKPKAVNTDEAPPTAS